MAFCIRKDVGVSFSPPLVVLVGISFGPQANPPQPRRNVLPPCPPAPIGPRVRTYALLFRQTRERDAKFRTTDSSCSPGDTATSQTERLPPGPSAHAGASTDEKTLHPPLGIFMDRPVYFPLGWL